MNSFQVSRLVQKMIWLCQLKRGKLTKKKESQLIKQAIADFYKCMEKHDSVVVYVIRDEYYIDNSGTGQLFDKGEIECAEASTSLPVEYIRLS